MGGFASLHFYAQEPDNLIGKISQSFETETPKKKEAEFFSALMRNFIQGDLDKTEDDTERKEKGEVIQQLMDQINASAVEDAIVIKCKNAVSLYADSIRVENLEQKAKRYSQKYGPLMGFSLQDGNNVVVVAADQGAIKARGFYWFDESDLSRIDVKIFQETLSLDCAPEELDAIFSLESGEEMAERLQQLLGLHLLLFPENCKAMRTLKFLQVLHGTTVYEYHPE